MTSADFSPFVVTTVSYSVSTADETSPGTTHFFLSIYLPYLLCTVPYSYRASVCLATLPLCFSLIWLLFVRPEICLHLPSDSVSRRTPLVFGYILPAAGRIRDFHPLETCAVGRTEKLRRTGVKVRRSFVIFANVNFVIVYLDTSTVRITSSLLPSASVTIPLMS